MKIVQLKIPPTYSDPNLEGSKAVERVRIMNTEIKDGAKASCKEGSLASLIAMKALPR